MTVTETPVRSNPWPQKIIEFSPAKDDRIYSITCTGKSPLLMDRFLEDQVNTLITYKPGCGPKPQAMLERCQGKIYRDDEGYPVLRAIALTACLQEAGRSIKVGEQKLFSQRRRTPYVLGIEPADIRLQFPADRDARSLLPSSVCEGIEHADPKSPWRVDIHRPTGEQGFASALIRPKFETWSFTFRLRAHSIWIDWIGGVETLHLLMTRAGNRVGLLSFRPACNGPFGRFKVDSIEVAQKTDIV